MAEPIPTEEQSNYETFRDCLSEPVIKALAAPIEKPKPKKKRHAKKGSKSAKSEIVKQETVPTNVNGNDEAEGTDAEDLGEFIEVRLLHIPIPTDSRTSLTKAPVPKQPDLSIPTR
jgi:hypothetical protein